MSAPTPIAPSRRPPWPCDPLALTRLGPLLCLYRALEPQPLSGWIMARWVRPRICVDADGPREALCFFAADGQLCWQLLLLPDSDYLAWDELVTNLDASTSPPLLPDERRDIPCPWAIHLAVGEPIWRACPLRLHAIGDARRGGALAVSQPQLSPAGQRAVSGISRCTASTHDIDERNTLRLAAVAR